MELIARFPARLSLLYRSGLQFGATLAISLVVLCRIQAAQAQPACDPTFAAPMNTTTGISTTPPVFVAACDFNHDGRPDLAILNDAQQLLIMLSTGNGTFAAPVSYPAGAFPSFIAVGDLDGDSVPDLVVANRGPDEQYYGTTVSVLLGLSNGSFQPAVSYSVGTGPTCIAIADVNGDGRNDLAVTNQVSNNVSILLGNAAPNQGTFAAAVNYPVSNGPQCVAAGDFNGDGQLDLAVGRSNSGVIILRGNPPPNAGTFQLANSINAFSVRSIVTLDYNRDGLPDLAAADGTSNRVSLWRGSSAGSFSSIGNITVGAQPGSLNTADFNLDGTPDLALVSGGTATVIRVATTGSLSQFSFGAGMGVRSVATAEFNQDGRPDLVLTTSQFDPSPPYGVLMSVLMNASTYFPPPVITQQPAPIQAIAAGQTATIRAQASGFGNTLTYQWRKGGIALTDGGNISGAATPTLTISPALTADAGSYDLRITAPACSPTNPVVLTTAAAVIAVTGSNPCVPLITQQPASQSIGTGGQVFFDVMASSPSNGGALTYQWRMNGANLVNGFTGTGVSISGATAAHLSVGHVRATENGAVFDCVITNACGTTTSSPAGLAVEVCQGDFDNNRVLDASDAQGFINALLAGQTCP